MTSCSTDICGIGMGGPLPGDPDNNSILSATSAFGGIDVSWSYPVTNPQAVAHVLLYRSASSDFGGAIRIAVVSGDRYYDKIEDLNRYYYWIQIVSINGTVGELIGPASAVAKPTIEGMIELLTGKIDAGLLAQTLKADLDKISVLNDNLLNEITSRENGEVTLAQAMADVDAGVAQALTFIHTEMNSRSDADAAIAEQLNIVAATLGDNLAAVTQSMTASIDALTGDVYAMYTAKVTVNSLIGGFGLINDGHSVEAGFDVDTFWVGRTNADKRKPFIISDGTVCIDEGAINKLTFNKLRDEAGDFLVENGRIKAKYIKVDSASIGDAEIGTAKIADAAITNAKIGYSLQSNNWDGNNGWYIDKGGTAYFMNVVARGNIQASSIDANTISVDQVISGSLNNFYTSTTGIVVTNSGTTAQAVRVSVYPVLTATGSGKDAGSFTAPVTVTMDGNPIGLVVGMGFAITYNVPPGVHTFRGQSDAGPYTKRMDVEVILR